VAARRWADIQAGRKLGAEALERIRRATDRDVLEMTLRALRESAGKTQEEMAELTAMSQPQLSRVERRDDHLLSTLRRYVQALGGHIEVVAVVAGKRIRLRGV
jgi:predicted transcriptional regulator